VFGLLVTGLVGAVVYGRSSTANTGDRLRATQLADEGIQAATNIRNSAYGNLADSALNVGNTAIENSADNNIGGTSAYKITTGATGGNVPSISMYIKDIDAANPHVQASLYADSAGAPGARLGVSAVQTAVPDSWNVFSLSGVTVSPNTNYWIAISEDGTTNFAAANNGGLTAYRLSGGYPSPDPFAADTAPNVWKMSFYLSIGATYGLAQSSGQWVFSGTSDTTGIFTRQITVTTTSTNRKLVTSTVTWPQANGSTNQVTATATLTNWLAAFPATATWPNAILAGSANATGTNAAAKVKAVGNYSYTVLSGTTSNFVITDISNPAAPSIVSTTTLAGTPTNIDISGDYAYITNTSNTAELQIVNISNPAAPTVSASVNMTGTGDGQGVYVSGSYAYVTRSSDSTTGANELTIVNITTPTVPVTIGGYNNNIIIYEVYVSGNYAYLATASGTQEMLVINVTNPAAPTLAATYNPAGLVATRTITGYGNTILLGVNTALQTVNVTTPTAPAQLGSIGASGIIYDVDVDATNQFAFLATGYSSGEFQVINIGTPATPTLAKAVNLSGNSAMGGVGYDTALDVVAGAGSDTSAEILVFTKN